MFFSKHDVYLKRSNGRAAPLRISEWGCTKTLSLVGVVDGILTKPRNQINHDSWLIDPMSTSTNDPLSLGLHVNAISTDECSFQQLSFHALSWRCNLPKPS